MPEDTISVGEIEAAVKGGPDSPAMDTIVGKLRATKRPPKRLHERAMKAFFVRVLGQFVDRPDIALFRMINMAVPAENIAKIARSMERDKRLLQLLELA